MRKWPSPLICGIWWLSLPQRVLASFLGPWGRIICKLITQNSRCVGILSLSRYALSLTIAQVIILLNGAHNSLPPVNMSWVLSFLWIPDFLSSHVWSLGLRSTAWVTGYILPHCSLSLWLLYCCPEVPCEGCYISLFSLCIQRRNPERKIPPSDLFMLLSYNSELFLLPHCLPSTNMRFQATN